MKLRKVNLWYKLQKDKSLMLLIFSASISILCIILGVIFSHWFIYLALISNIISTFLLSEQNIYVLLFSIVPFANIYKPNPTSTSLFTYYCLFTVAYLILKHKKYDIKFVISFIFCIAYLLLRCENDIKLLIKLCIGLLLIYFFVRCDKTSDIYYKITIFFSISIIVSSVLPMDPVFYNAVKGYLREVSYATGSEITRFCGLITDPNYYTMMIVMAQILLITQYYIGRAQKLFWVLSIFILYFGVSTYSKSFFFIYILLALFFIFFVLTSRKKILFIASLPLLIYTINVIIQGRIESVNLILERIQTAKDLNSLTTGRLYLLFEYIRYIFSDVKVFLIGEGLDTVRIAGLNNVHNLYIESLFKIGFIGIILFIITLISALRRKSNYLKGKRKLLNYLGIIIFSILYFFLAGLTSFELPFYIIICYICKDIDFKNLNNDLQVTPLLDKNA